MMSWACLMVYMQHTLEQSELPMVQSREPVHMTKAMLSGYSPSEGRSVWLKGLVGDTSRSICMAVMTLG